MPKIVSWSIVNNEISFIKELIDYHLTWIDAMYILDTGSVDGTLEYLRDAAANDSRIVLEEYSIKYTPQYELDWLDIENPFPEVEVRNYAIRRAEELLKPNWLIQLDGDEVCTEEAKNLILYNNNYACIGHHTINPVSELNHHNTEIRHGVVLYDPHVRIWKANNNIRYFSNPAFGGKQIHCIPGVTGSNRHLFHHPNIRFIDDAFFFHLHWMYGSKVEKFYLHNKNITDKNDILSTQCYNNYSNNLPELFWNKRNVWLNDNNT